MKQWAATIQTKLWDVIGDRYIVFGEWLYAKHTMFYDNLTHYWMEFDIYDKVEQAFLDTPTRKLLLGDLPIVPVKVLKTGLVNNISELEKLIAPSHFISANSIEILRQTSNLLKLRLDETYKSTDMTGLMEGLYVKWEDNGVVKGRYKFVRNGFLQTMLISGEHWQDRPIIPNQLASGVNIWTG